MPKLSRPSQFSLIIAAILLAFLLFNIGLPFVDQKKQDLEQALLSAGQSSYDISEYSSGAASPMRLELDRAESELIVFTFPITSDFSSKGLPRDVAPIVFLKERAGARIVFKDKENAYQALETDLSSAPGFSYEFKRSASNPAKTVLELSNGSGADYLVAVSTTRDSEKVTNDSVRGQLAYLAQNLKGKEAQDAYPVIEFFIARTSGARRDARSAGIRGQQLGSRSLVPVSAGSGEQAGDESQRGAAANAMSKELKAVSKLQKASRASLALSSARLSALSKTPIWDKKKQKENKAKLRASYQGLAASTAELRKYVDKNRKVLLPVLKLKYFQLVKSISGFADALAKKKSAGSAKVAVASKGSEKAQGMARGGNTSEIRKDAASLKLIGDSLAALNKVFAAASTPKPTEGNFLRCKSGSCMLSPVGPDNCTPINAEEECNYYGCNDDIIPSCVKKPGTGPDKCIAGSKPCSYGTCNAETKACDAIKGEGDSECSSSGKTEDCTHYRCYTYTFIENGEIEKVQTCMADFGPGPDKCDGTNPGECSHYECSSSLVCARKPGEGENKCDPEDPSRDCHYFGCAISVYGDVSCSALPGEEDPKNPQACQDDSDCHYKACGIAKEDYNGDGVDDLGQCLTKVGKRTDGKTDCDLSDGNDCLHLECGEKNHNLGQCIFGLGEGNDSCNFKLPYPDNGCSHGECDDGSCVLKPGKKLGDNAVGCFIDAHCPPKPTPTSTPSTSPSGSPTASATATSTVSSTPSASATSTPSVSSIATSTPSATPTGSATSTASATATSTVSSTPSATATPSVSSTATSTASATPTPSPTSTPSTSPSASPSVTATSTGSATPTSSATATSTVYITPIATPTPIVIPTPIATLTPTPTSTPSATASATVSVSPTTTPSASESPSESPSETPSPDLSPTQVDSLASLPANYARAQLAKPQPRSLSSLPSNGSLVGSDSAKVKLTVYQDVNCGMCSYAFKEILPEIASEYVSKGQVQIVFKEYPLMPGEPQKRLAQAIKCSGDQGRYVDYLSSLYEKRDKQLEDSRFIARAVDVGLDEKRFSLCLKTGKYRTSVENDIADGQKLGINGTPTFYVNKTEVLGAKPFDKFKEVIEAELKLL